MSGRSLDPPPLVDVALLAELESQLFPSAHRPVTVGRYELLETLGAGGFGAVYLAHDPQLERKVALKLVHHQRARAAAELDGESPLMLEAKALAQLSHPNVVQVFDAGVFDLSAQGFDELGEIPARGVFIVMEYVEGRDLASWLHARPRRWPEILDVFRAAGQGLAAAHRLGIIHRDFKPANVLVGEDGSVRVADFGLARALEHAPSPELSPDAPEDPLPGFELSAPLAASTVLRLDGADTIAGTPRYMGPEQFSNQRVSPRTDQYAFCTALYEALYGHHPIEATSLLGFARKVIEGELRPPKRGDVPEWLEAIVLRGLATDPDQRYLSLDALLYAIKARSSTFGLIEDLAKDPIAASSETAQGYRSYISWLEPGIILYREGERVSHLSVDVTRHELTLETRDLPHYVMLCDITGALMPGPDVRVKLREMFSDEHMLLFVVYYGDDPLRRFAAQLVLEPIPPERYVITPYRERALELLREALRQA